MAKTSENEVTDDVATISRYEQYKVEITADITSTIERLGCQPILFIGSGLSRRYFSGPSWNELLEHLAKTCPVIDKEYAYYQQTLGGPLAIGHEFARLYQQWAWSAGRRHFPEKLFAADVPTEVYIKHEIARHLMSITPADLKNITGAGFVTEIAAMQNIRPHTVITTNYTSTPWKPARSPLRNGASRTLPG